MCADLSEPMAAGYNPIAVESAWYDWWDKQGFFKPRLTPEGKPLPAGNFVIPFPPPNVTGTLHIGHGLTVSIEDSLVRWYAALSRRVLVVGSRVLSIGPACVG